MTAQELFIGTEFGWPFDGDTNLCDVWETLTPRWIIHAASIDGVLPDKYRRLFAVFCAKQVSHLFIDDKPKAAIDVAERYANGEASLDDLVNAHQMARKYKHSINPYDYDIMLDAALCAEFCSVRDEYLMWGVQNSSHSALRIASHLCLEQANYLKSLKGYLL